MPVLSIARLKLERPAEMNIWLMGLCIVLAAVIGFAAHRASLCSVRAMEEILTTRRAFMLSSFIKSSLWVAGISAIVAFFIPIDLPVRDGGWEMSLYSVAGGLLFGVGATINGGCAFSTLTRLGSGDMGMLASLIGFIFSAGLMEADYLNGIAPPPVAAETAVSQYEVWQAPLAFLLCFWMLWECPKLLRTLGVNGWGRRIIAPRYRLSSAAALMGASNAVLFAIVGAWQYTQVLGDAAESMVSGASSPAEILWVLFAALISGVFVSTWQSNRFRWRPLPTWKWLAYICGGFLMGIGASLVPGGNDVLIFQGLPSLSPHAIPAFVSMLVGIAITLVLLRLMGRAIPKIDCGGDICTTDPN